MENFHKATTFGLALALIALTMWNARLHDLTNQQEQILRTMHICLESPRYDTFAEAKSCLDSAQQNRIDALLTPL